ncbi:MER3 [Scenedesmus sp. PABB004]|nr:MER3 [Scenedesmus sp. PABB004]
MARAAAGKPPPAAAAAAAAVRSADASCGVACGMQAFAKAAALHRAGCLAEAEVAYRELLRAQPAHADALCNLGALLVQRGAAGAGAAEAERLVRAAVQLAPGSARFRHSLGVVLEARRDWTAAAEAYEHAAEKAPGDARAGMECILEAAAPGGGGGAAAPAWARCADLGCGTGLMGPLLRPHCSGRLCGVDLSSGMVERAQQRGCYNDLAVAELLSWLRQQHAAGVQLFDLLVAADVFVYIGDLSPVFTAAADVAADGALFAFSTELLGSADGAGGEAAVGAVGAAGAAAPGFELQTTGRFAHSPAWLRAAAAGAGWEELAAAALALLLAALAQPMASAQGGGGGAEVIPGPPAPAADACGAEQQLVMCSDIPPGPATAAARAACCAAHAPAALPADVRAAAATADAAQQAVAASTPRGDLAGDLAWPPRYYFGSCTSQLSAQVPVFDGASRSVWVKAFPVPALPGDLIQRVKAKVYAGLPQAVRDDIGRMRTYSAASGFQVCVVCAHARCAEAARPRGRRLAAAAPSAPRPPRRAAQHPVAGPGPVELAVMRYRLAAGGRVAVAARDSLLTGAGVRPKVRVNPDGSTWAPPTSTPGDGYFGPLPMPKAAMRWGGADAAPGTCPPNYPARAPAGACGHVSFVELDAQMAYKLALAWHATGDDRHARKAFQILDAWAGANREWGVRWENGPLEAGWGVAAMARALELLRHKAPSGLVAKFVGWVNAVPMKDMDYYVDVVSAQSVPNLWGNWHSTVAEAFMAVGILADDRGRYAKGVRVFQATVADYLKWGKGAYASGRILGESSETMRDMYHAQFGLGGLLQAAELAWQQNEDLYAAGGHALAAAMELHARVTNAWLDGSNAAALPPGYRFFDGGMPQAPAGARWQFDVRKQLWTAVRSSDGAWVSDLRDGVKYMLGNGFLPTGWEVGYNHYAGRLGVQLPETARMLARSWPEWQEFHWGLGTLTHAGTAQALWRDGVKDYTLCGARRRSTRGAAAAAVGEAGWARDPLELAALYANSTAEMPHALLMGEAAGGGGAGADAGAEVAGAEVQHPGHHPYQQHHQQQQAPYVPPYSAPAPHLAAAGRLAPDNPSAAEYALKAVRDLPAAFQPLFPFSYFNPVQSECFDVAARSDANMVVSAPTGAGKTGVMELAVLRVLARHLAPGGASLAPPRGRAKVVYLGPIKALVQERQADWARRFGGLGLSVVQLTGDVDDDGVEAQVEAADVICSTPEKFDQVTRVVKERGAMGFCADICLVLIDEVHLLNEAGRGSALEAGCVCRIKALAALPELAQARAAARRALAGRPPRSAARRPAVRDRARAAARPQAPIARARFVAVSATIPNITDIAAWLCVPPGGVLQYGEELRPCKLTTHVKGYAPAKNDFLFERRLNDYLYAMVSGYSSGRPALVFCNSRKGAMDAAAVLAKAAEAAARGAGPGAGALGRPGLPPGGGGGGGGAPGAATGSALVKTAAQLARLQAAAARAQAKALGAALVCGVGFHHAAMEPTDRELVEGLFKANELAVLCTTSTLAMGVNLPAHLVIIKGTTRYAGDGEAGRGEPAGYKEYTQTEVLQMVGRAGRPQFDTEGVAVIMTSRDSTARYQQLLEGQARRSGARGGAWRCAAADPQPPAPACARQAVESCLASTLAEQLLAEVVLGTVRDVPGAIAWLKSTFLYVRVRSNPGHYGLRLRAGMSEAELDGVLKQALMMEPVQELLKYGLIATDEDSYGLGATAPGRLMAAHFLKLRTMAGIVGLGERPSVPSLLRVICGAEEFRATSLRRCERKVLNAINHAANPAALRHSVMAAPPDGPGAPPSAKVKERITSAQEKLFILLNDGLADKPSEALDYSLKQEQERVLVVGQRIAKCMARYYVLRDSFSAAGRSLLLARSLRAKLWDDSGVTVRQLPAVGRLLGARLAVAGLGTLRALAACGDAHQIEVAAQKPYPWGSELLANLRAITPPAVSMDLEVLEQLPTGVLACRLTLTRTAPPVAAAGGPWQQGGSGQPRGEAAAGASGRALTTFTPCKLLCGCSTTDQLLLLRGLVLETFESPLQLSFRVDPPADPNQPTAIAARLILERVVGLDETARLEVPPRGGRAPGRGSWQRGTAAADGPAGEAGWEDSEPDEEGLDGGARQAAPQKGGAAAAGTPRRPRAAKRALAADGGGGAAAKQPCGPRRQRQQQVLPGPAPGGSAHCAAGVSPPGEAQAQLGGTADGGGSGAGVPNTALATRYQRMLHSGGAAAAAQQACPTEQPASEAEPAEPAAPARPAAVAALDAAGLQVTPDHARLSGGSDTPPAARQDGAAAPLPRTSARQAALAASQAGGSQAGAGGAGLSISAMFDMLADELAGEQQAGPQSPRRVAPAPEAPAAPAAAAASSRASEAAGAPWSSGAPRGLGGSVFGAAVLQRLRASGGMGSSQRSLGSSATVLAAPPALPSQQLSQGHAGAEDAGQELFTPPRQILRASRGFAAAETAAEGPAAIGSWVAGGGGAAARRAPGTLPGWGGLRRGAPLPPRAAEADPGEAPPVRVAAPPNLQQFAFGAPGAPSPAPPEAGGFRPSQNALLFKRGAAPQRPPVAAGGGAQPGSGARPLGTGWALPRGQAPQAPLPLPGGVEWGGFVEQQRAPDPGRQQAVRRAKAAWGAAAPAPRASTWQRPPAVLPALPALPAPAQPPEPDWGGGSMEGLASLLGDEPPAGGAAAAPRGAAAVAAPAAAAPPVPAVDDDDGLDLGAIFDFMN